MDFDHKKMKKNGYSDVKIKIPIEGLKRGDTVYVIATEFGELDNNSLVTCFTDDNKKIVIPKRNLSVK